VAPSILALSRAMTKKRELDDMADDESLRNLSIIFEKLCGSNHDLRSVTPTRFDGVDVPGMSVSSYLARLRRYTHCDFNSFLVAITYIKRLCGRDVAFCPTHHNIHRLLVTGLLVASKAMDDAFHTNRVMAQCGGIHVSEMCQLEWELCKRLDWRLQSEAEQLVRLRAALCDARSAYWDGFRGSTSALPHAELPTTRVPPAIRGVTTRSSSDARYCEDSCELSRVSSPHSVMDVARVR